MIKIQKKLFKMLKTETRECKIRRNRAIFIKQNKTTDGAYYTSESKRKTKGRMSHRTKEAFSWLGVTRCYNNKYTDEVKFFRIDFFFSDCKNGTSLFPQLSSNIIARPLSEFISIIYKIKS